MFEEIWSAIAIISGFAMCGLVVYFLIAGRHDREIEEQAREYFDAHGHWPDEEPTP